nr:palmitoyltransferase ZDHHC3-like [Dasypus novemcinctus]
MPGGSGDVRADPAPRYRERAPELAPRPAFGPRAPPARRVWFVCDALGIACAAGVWVAVLYAAGVLLFHLLLPARDVAYGVANGALFQLLALLALAAHARTVLTDPGAVPPPPPGAAPAARCAHCGAASLEGAHHCHVCRRCVRGMDHHCPWVNNCVGAGNRKYFVLFTLYTALASLHVVLLLGVRAVRSYRRGEWDAHSTVSPRASVLVLFLVALEGLLFSSVMLGIQVHAICTARRRPEPLQGDRCARLKAVFGRGFSLAWISPFASPEPQNAWVHHDVV